MKNGRFWDECKEGRKENELSGKYGWGKYGGVYSERGNWEDKDGRSEIKEYRGWKDSWEYGDWINEKNEIECKR